LNISNKYSILEFILLIKFINKKNSILKGIKMRNILKSLGIILIIFLTSNCLADSNEVVIQQGNITCANPIDSNHAATKEYVDSAIASSPSSSCLVQVRHAQTQNYISTGDTPIPFDNTIPQSNEGAEILTVCITPTSATNLLRIEAVINGFSSGLMDTYAIAALFQDSNANALASGSEYGDGLDGGIAITYYMTAGTTSPTTFKLRCGSMYVNGWNHNRLLGGATVTSLTVTEYNQ
jgi:hypothetical protein